MKKILVFAAAVLLAAGAVSCGKKGGAEIALITDVGTIDDKSFNQGAWEGLTQYAKEHGISYKYYKPAEKSDHAFMAGIDLAVKGGAKIVVTPGYLFEVPVYEAQERYPDVAFILVDGSPHNNDYTDFKIGPNTVGVSYAEEESGYLAGYAVVKEGLMKLGFMGGMRLPAVVRFGYGFVQGANAAGVELGLPDGSLAVNYHYTGAFEATPEAKALAASWYNDGVEVIFACGGQLGNSVMAAAQDAGKKVIGVDVDQSYESPTVITSAMKGLNTSVYDCIKKYYDGEFPGGQNVRYSAKNDGVSLALDTGKFEKFTKDDYDAIFAKIKSGEVKVLSDTDVDEASKIPVKVVTVKEVK